MIDHHNENRGKKAEMKSCQPEGNECSINLLIIFWINWADFFFSRIFSTTLICFTYSAKKKMFKISKLSSRPYDIISGVNTFLGIFFKCIYIFSLVYRKIALLISLSLCLFFISWLLHLPRGAFRQVVNFLVIFSFCTIGYYHLPHIIIENITVNII